MKKFIYPMLALFCVAFAFTSCEDVPMPYDQPGEGGEEPVVVEPTGDGTADNPFNVAAALEYINNLGADVESDRDVYIKGKVVTVTEEYSTNFGNGTFYISDDGTNKNQFYVYRAMYLGNKKFANGNTQIQEGDDVIICGRVVNYRGTTPETVQNKSFLYSLNGETAGGGTPAPSGDPTGSGTQADPYNSVAANNLANGLSDNAKSDNVYIKGKVVSIKEQYGTQFGNATFYISDSGTETDQFYVYRALYLGNKKYTAGELLKEGDEVVVYGKVTKYVSQYGTTLETVQGEAYLYSLNGKTEGSGEEPQPSGDVKAVSIADFNAAAESTDVWYQLTGTVKNLKDGDQYGNFDLKDATGSVYVYGLLSEKGGEKKKFQELVAAKGIQEGSTITIIGNRGSYNGKIEVMNAYFVSIGEGGGGGGETPAGNVTKTVDGNVVTLVVADAAEGDKVTVDLSAQGWESGKAVDPATITLSDGTKITFAKGEGSNTPAFYEATKGVRVYAKNTITISGKAVAKVVMTCDSYNGTAYTGNSTLYASASGTSFVICNEHSEAKGGDQLRVQTIEITYAK